MKLITLDPFNQEQNNLILKSDKGKELKSLIDSLTFKDKDEYKIFKNESNDILECLICLNEDSISNYCIYSGTKDNKLIQMKIDNLKDKKFVKESVDYAFLNLNAYTITIFSNKDSKLLESLGFESLGSDDGITTYIKEKELDLEMERVR